MKTSLDVQRFFENDLKQKLEVLEQRRLHVIHRYSFKPYRTTLKVLALLDVIAIITSMAFPASPLRWFTLLIPFTAVVALAYPIALWILRASRFKIINKSYKNEIIPELLRFIQPTLNYNPGQGIPRRAVDDSLLFDAAYGTYRSEDLVEGTIGAVYVKLADATLQRKSQSARNSSVVTIFSGLFCQVDLNRQFSSHTIIEPDLRDGMTMNLVKKIFGDEAVDIIEQIGKKMESLASGLIETGDPRFDRYFSVFTHDEKETRTLLTPSVTSKIADFREKIGHIIHLSFTNQHMNLAIDAPDLFEGAVEESFQTFDNFRDYIEVLLLTLSLAEEIRPMGQKETIAQGAR